MLRAMNFFDYFELASIAAAVFIFVVRASYLLFVKDINPIAIGRGKKGFQLAFELIAFAGLGVWMMEVVLCALHSSFHIFPPPLDSRIVESFIAKAIGCALVTSGLILFTLAFVSFGDSWRVGFDVRTPGKLVTNGVFAVSRNPIYVSLGSFFGGAFLIYGTLGFLIFVALAAVAIHWQILREEKFLFKLYGEPYRSYCAGTARYFIW
jgi:protein-S-isoprenylcysteine O-methyltransferase Ste14